MNRCMYRFSNNCCKRQFALLECRIVIAYIFQRGCYPALPVSSAAEIPIDMLPGGPPVQKGLHLPEGGRYRNWFSLYPFSGSCSDSRWCCDPAGNGGFDMPLEFRRSLAFPHPGSLATVGADINVLRLCNICRRNRRYVSLCHTSLKLFSFRSPSVCCASLSKQQGTTSPSLTDNCSMPQAPAMVLQLVLENKFTLLFLR